MTFEEFYANEVFKSIIEKSLYETFRNNLNTLTAQAFTVNAVPSSSPYFMDNLPMMMTDDYRNSVAGLFEFRVFLRVQ